MSALVANACPISCERAGGREEGVWFRGRAAGAPSTVAAAACNGLTKLHFCSVHVCSD